MNNITKFILCNSRKLCEDVGKKFIKNGKISEFGTYVCLLTTISFVNMSFKKLKKIKVEENGSNNS